MRLLARAAVAALTLAATPSALRAQGAAPAPDSGTRALPPVVVTAGEARWHGLAFRLTGRAEMTAVMRENRLLAARLAAYDRRVAALQARLDSLRTIVTDSLRGDIARLDSAGAATHARRVALEARVHAMEAARPAAPPASPPR